MAFTEEDLLEQEKELDALKDELSRMNARFDGMLKDFGVSPDDLHKAMQEKRSPELEEAVQAAREEAERAGKTRAAQARRAEKPVADKPAPRGRPGAVRL